MNPEAYLSAIEYYEENLTEDNLDQIIVDLADIFGEHLLQTLYEQGFFIAPSKRN
tara:strand:+ start:84 stop:248 length:165 start_codon:yes stop_codon:yes gene_type:complete